VLVLVPGCPTRLAFLLKYLGEGSPDVEAEAVLFPPPLGVAAGLGDRREVGGGSMDLCRADWGDRPRRTPQAGLAIQALQGRRRAGAEDTLQAGLELLVRTALVDVKWAARGVCGKEPLGSGGESAGVIQDVGHRLWCPRWPSSASVSGCSRSTDRVGHCFRAARALGTRPRRRPGAAQMRCGPGFVHGVVRRSGWCPPIRPVPGVRSVHVEYVFSEAQWTQTFLSPPLTTETFELALAGAGLAVDACLTGDRRAVSRSRSMRAHASHHVHLGRGAAATSRSGSRLSVRPPTVRP
jgi:hypothetical protein